MKETTKRSALLQVRLTPAEHKAIYDDFSKSTCRKLSDYARKKLFNKPVKMYTRNQSLDDFMSEMIRLRNELNAIGNNFNQLVKRLHMLEPTGEIKQWIQVNENSRQLLLGKIEQIRSKITQINDQWLQS